MDVRMSIDGAAGMLLLSLPWLLLAAAAWRAARAGRAAHEPRQGQRRMGADTPVGAVSDILSAAPVETTEPMGLAAPVPALSGAAVATEGGGEMTEAAVVGEPSPARSRQQEEEALVLAVSAAKAERNDAALSRNSVLLARVLLERSARAEAATLLQSAALIARRAKLPVVHAEARIELAEMARADGDMASACEHWQMAKLMFHETGRRADRDRMADFMRQHHCPTDWVLTNF